VFLTELLDGAGELLLLGGEHTNGLLQFSFGLTILMVDVYMMIALLSGVSHTVAEVIDRARELADLTRQVLDGRG
jgi:hypothetical protein